MVWYGILGFNVPLETVQVISETGTDRRTDRRRPLVHNAPIL